MAMTYFKLEEGFFEARHGEESEVEILDESDVIGERVECCC
jgi:hypothetical protein